MPKTLSRAHPRLAPKSAKSKEIATRKREAYARINHDLDSFIETIEACVHEDNIRAKLIRKSLSDERPTSLVNIDETKAEVLAGTLEGATISGIPQLTLASFYAMRCIRVRLIGCLLAALHDYPNDELRTFTVLNTSWALTPEELNSKTATQIKNQFQTHLKRAGVFDFPGPFVAFLHGEFEPTKGVFVLHFHGVTTREKANALHALKKLRGYARTHTGATPIMRKTVNDRIRQLTYLLKGYWHQKGVRLYSEETERRDGSGSRIRGLFHTQYLLWLDRQKLGDMAVLNDCWSRRNGGPPAMRSLYLSIFGRCEEGPE